MAQKYEYDEWDRNLDRSTTATLARASFLHAADVTRGFLQAEPDLTGAELLARFEAAAVEQAQLHEHLEFVRSQMKK